MHRKRDSLLVEISWILTVNLCLIFPEANNKNSLFVTSFPLVGFSRAIGQKFSVLCVLNGVLNIYLLSVKSEVTAVF